jgi:hypothetical protein
VYARQILTPSTPTTLGIFSPALCIAVYNYAKSTFQPDPDGQFAVAALVKHADINWGDAVSVILQCSCHV